MEINKEVIEKLIEKIKEFIKSVAEAFHNFTKWVQEHWKLIKFCMVKESKSTPRKISNRNKFPIKKMQHQVIDRRPRYAVRKIIK